MLVLLHCLHFVYPFEMAFHGKPTFSEKKTVRKKWTFVFDMAYMRKCEDERNVGMAEIFLSWYKRAVSRR